MRTPSRYTFDVVEARHNTVLATFKQARTALKEACRHTGQIDLRVTYVNEQGLTATDRFGWYDPKAEHMDSMMDYTHKMCALLAVKAHEKGNR